MQHHTGDLVVVNVHAIHDLAHQLMTRLVRTIDVVTCLPVGAEVGQQISGLDQLIVVQRAQRVDLLLKLAALFQILFLADESLLPREVDALDNRLNLGHALQ
ncbi:MAG TPA: hypothetical protein PKX07_07520 [Aggregatilineales bacterium]|nr:hypothetical protein [Aggregatilineales bacterium]